MSGQAVDTSQDFAGRLDSEIVRRGWTNEEAARAIGVPERQIRRWRKGTTMPGRSSIEKVGRFFGWGLR